MSLAKLTTLNPSIPLVLTILALSFTTITPVQQAGAASGKQDKQEMVGALKQSIAQNKAALEQYTWTETTEISLKGEVKKQEQKECHYGPDGTIEKTPIQSDDQAQQQQQQPQQAGGHRRRSGPLKQKIVEHKVGEMKEYMERVASLVHEYVPPDPQKIQAAVAAGNVSIQPLPSQEITTITFKDYLKAGDSLALGFDPNTKKIHNYNVQSYLDSSKDETVTLVVTFASLPDGTNYAQQSVVNVPGKNIQVEITNSGYVKTGK